MLAKLAIGGGLGFLLGIALVWWVEPAEAGGTGLLILIPTVACTVSFRAPANSPHRRSLGGKRGPGDSPLSRP
jgi:hypothetical protein